MSNVQGGIETTNSIRKHHERDLGSMCIPVPPQPWRRVSAFMVSFVVLGACSIGNTETEPTLSVGAVEESVDGQPPMPSTSSESAGSGGASNEAYTIAPRPANVQVPKRNRSDDPATDAALLATYALELYPYVLATGELEEWKAISHPECDFCNSVIADVEEANQYGGWTDVSFELKDSALFSVAEGNVDWRVDLLVARSDMTYHESESAEIVQANEHTVVIGLLEIDGAAKIRSFDIVSPDRFGDEELGAQEE